MDWSTQQILSVLAIISVALILVPKPYLSYLLVLSVILLGVALLVK